AGAAAGEPLQEVAAGVAGADRLGERAVDRSGVQVLLDLEDRGAGDVVAVQHRVLDGGRAAPGRQQGEVQVDPAVPGDVQRLPAEQRPVGDHRAAVRGDLAQPVQEGGVARLGGLEDLHPRLL